MTRHTITVEEIADWPTVAPLASAGGKDGRSKRLRAVLQMAGDRHVVEYVVTEGRDATLVLSTDSLTDAVAAYNNVDAWASPRRYACASL